VTSPLLRLAGLLAASLSLCFGAGCRSRTQAAPLPSAPTEASPDYRNVAREVGLRFAWGKGRNKIWSNREGFGSGCAFVDYNRDGWMDILLAGQPRCGLFRNRKDGTFEDVTAQVGLARAGEWTGIAAGDYDNDGYPDLYISGFECSMLLRNQAGRAFVDRTSAAGLGEKEWGTSCGFFDYDTDGDLDLLVGHYVVTGPKYPSYCQGERGVLTGCPPMVYPPQFPRLYRNEGQGKFKDVTNPSGLGMAHGKALALQFADYDNDGRLDFYIANDGEPGDLFHAVGGGRYENASMRTGTAFGMAGEAQAGMGVDFGDYDRNGLLDLVVTTFRDETYSLYRNLGHLFEGATAASGLTSTRDYLGFGTRFLDYNDDTWPDLVFANGHVYSNAGENDPGALVRQPTLLYHNQRGTFARVTAGGSGLELPIVGRGMAVGDSRNDGGQELLIVDHDGEVVLLRNHRRSANHWLGVELRGVASNRDGYGARVTVEWPGGKSFRDCSAAGSYLSSMDPRLHFGLGDHSGPVALSVRWPSGRESRMNGVATDRYIRVTEPNR